MATMMQTIQRVMKSSGESRYSIAKRSGISQARLSRLVSGESPTLRVDTLEALADALGYDLILTPRRNKRATKARRGK